VPIYINSTYLQQHADSFTGVSVASDVTQYCKNLAARQVALRRPVHVHAMLYFCSNHHIKLLQPVVERLLLPYVPPSNNTDDDVSRSTAHVHAILAFGGSVRTSIDGGTFDQNLGTTMFFMQQAVVSVNNSTFTSNNSTHEGKLIIPHAADMSPFIA
jgi:hypothetical protein